VRVAVDGPPATGKTTLADELALVLRNRGREVIRSSIESFLLPRTQRYRRGQDSPEGCYHDSFDFHVLHRVLLDPLGPDGVRRFQQAVYDRHTDTALSPPVTTAAADAVLLFDGVFLLRPELIDRRDLRIFMSAAFEETLARARIRDLPPLGSVEGQRSGSGDHEPVKPHVPSVSHAPSVCPKGLAGRGSDRS
jgi:uridine kinase